MKIKIANKDGKPLNLKRAHPYDAGVDIPFTRAETILRNSTITIPTGVHVEIPKGFAGVLISRTSAAAQGLLVHMSPIDHGYTGEIHIIVTNTNDYAVHLLADKPIAQLVVFPIVLVEPEEEPAKPRADGAFGSTNKV